MTLHVHRLRVLGLLEAEPASAAVLAMADALLGTAAAERFTPVAVSGSSGAEKLPWEPCQGDEMAVLPFSAAQDAVVSVGVVHGERLAGRRPMLGIGSVTASKVAAQVRLQGAELLVMARGTALQGATLSEVIAVSQIPAVVAVGSPETGIRKVGVLVEPTEGCVPLMKQALVLAASLGVPLVPVMVLPAALHGRGAEGQEAKRFQQIMGEVELPFGVAYSTRTTMQPLEIVTGEAIDALHRWITQAEVHLLVVASGRSDRSLLALEGAAAALVESSDVALWVEPSGRAQS